MMKMIKTKENKIFVFAVVVLIIAIVVPYFSMRSSSGYTMGITKERIKGKYGTIEVKYTYSVDGSSYTGSFAEKIPFANMKRLKVPKGRYLVIYSKHWPTWSQLVYGQELGLNVNIDSLESVEVDKSLIRLLN